MKFLSFLALAGVATVAVAEAQTLDRIQSSGTLNLGYRADALPFSYKDAEGSPQGYSVDLCKEVAAEVKSSLGLDDLNVEFVEVGTEERFTAIEDGSIDLLCGATTVTLDRRERVDFSLLTFVTGATVLYHTDGPSSFEALAEQRIGVRGGTTTEQGLNNALADLGVEADIVTFDDHDTAIDALAANQIEAYFADRAILIFNYIERGEPDDLMLSDRVFSNEPYALAMTHGDDAFRLLVDRALSKTYGRGRIDEIYKESFGNVPPTQLLISLYRLNTIPQ
ncbi:MAG: amino acid ABC transporter substrate-binding protein [Pseudomonadota bacterium]